MDVGATERDRCRWRARGYLLYHRSLFMTIARSRTCILAVCLFGASQSAAQTTGPVELVVRVFDGLQEITGECDVAVYPTGMRDTIHAPDSHRDSGHHVEVEPGFYDVQVSWRGAAGGVAIEWVRHLPVFWYPDDGPYHLEIVNVQSNFGALIVRPPTDRAATPRRWHVSAFLDGALGRAGFEPVGGTQRHLFILPAGRYDVVARQGATERQLGDIDIPAGRTRLTLLESSR